MALVGVRPTQSRQEIVGAHKGGAQTGQLAGAAIGGAVGAYFGGPAGAVGGATAGGNLGGMVGNAVAPAKEGTAIDRRVASQAPAEVYHSERSDQLRQSLAALNTQPPEIQQQYSQPLVTAYLSSLANDHTGMALPGQQQQPGVA